MSRAGWWTKFVLIQAGLTLLLVEIALHFVSPLPFRIRGDRIVLPVHKRYTFTTEWPTLDPVVHQSRNALGFRGPDPPRDLAGRISIITIGGSTTENRLLSDGKTWVDVLAATLAPSFPGLWVNNAGFDGHSTYGHLILLDQVVVPLRPTVAIFLTGANDIGLTRPMPNDAKLVADPSWWRRWAGAAIEHVELLGIAQNLWRYREAQRQGLGHVMSSVDVAPTLTLSRAEIEATVEEFRPMLAGYSERLAAIVEVCRRAGIEPVLMTQPALFDGVDLYTGKDTATLRVNERANGALEWRLYELHNDVTRGLARDRGVFLIDLARELPRDSRLYYDFVHYTNAGAAKVGAIIAGHLEPFLRERFSQAQPAHE